MPRKTFRPKRRPRRKTKKPRAVGQTRPQFSLTTLQLSNKRPSTIRVPVQLKMQYFVKALSTKPGDGFVGFWRANAPYDIEYIDITACAPMLTATTASYNPGAYSKVIDQMKNMYSHYYVSGSKMDWSLKFLEHRTIMDEVYLITNPNQQVQGVYTGITRDKAIPDDGTQPDQLVEAHNFKEHRVLCGTELDLATTAGINAPATAGSKRIQGTMYYSPKKLLGIKDVGDNENLRYSTTAALPATSEDTFFCIDVQHALTKTLGQAGKMERDCFNDFYLDVKLSYNMVFSEPSIIAGENLRGGGHVGAVNAGPAFVIRGYDD